LAAKPPISTEIVFDILGCVLQREVQGSCVQLCVLHYSHILIHVAMLFLLNRLPQSLAFHTPHPPSPYNLRDRSGFPPQDFAL
jgi:hypothetical protein